MYRYRNILFYTDNVMLLDKYVRKIQLMEDWWNVWREIK
jgi:hypothetical protein